MPKSARLLLFAGLAVVLLFSKLGGVTAQDDDDLDVEDVDDEVMDDLDDDDADDLDDDVADDLDDDVDPWDNTGDVQGMADMGDGEALPRVAYAVLHVNGGAITENIREFMHYESQNYPTLSVADVNADPPVIKFFASENEKLHDTVATAIEAGKMTEADIDKVIPGEQLRTDVEPFDIEELVSESGVEMELDEIMGLLADRNVHRSDPDDGVDSDDGENLESVDEVDLEGKPMGDIDGEQQKPPKRKKRNWRERRQARLEKEEKQRQKKKDDFKPSYNLGTGVGLQVPGWGLFLLLILGCAGVGFLVYMLQRILQESKDRDRERNEKREKREKRKLQKEKSRGRSKHKKA